MAWLGEPVRDSQEAQGRNVRFREPSIVREDHAGDPSLLPPRRVIRRDPPPIAVDVPRGPLAGERPFPNPHPWKEAAKAPFQLRCLPWTLATRYSFDMLPERGVRRGDGMQDRARPCAVMWCDSAKTTAGFE